MAAPKGNTYAANSKRWKQAIENALNKRNESRADKLDALDVLAEKLLAKCDEGDMTAIKEFGDRMDGKPSQAIDVGGQADNPLVTELVVRVVEAGS
jgi:hypothetical protein